MKRVIVSLSLVLLFSLAVVPLSAWATAESNVGSAVPASSVAAGDFAVAAAADYGVMPVNYDHYITLQTADQTVVIGDTVLLSVSIDSSVAPYVTTYAWDFSNTANFSEYSNVLFVENPNSSYEITSLAQSGYYRCRVSTSEGLLGYSAVFHISVVESIDPAPTPAPDPTPTPSPDIPESDSYTIWDKPFEQYTTTEGYLFLIFTLIIVYFGFRIFKGGVL